MIFVQYQLPIALKYLYYSIKDFIEQKIRSTTAEGKIVNIVEKINNEILLLMEQCKVR